jgi:uncharacterized caspase-like protein
MSRKADLPPNINVLTRSLREGPRDGTRRVALVVGNAGYAHVAPLPNADRDAESVAAALSESGFLKVTVATNVDRRQLEAALEQFAGEAAQADWAVVYYAGHGVEVGSRNFLIPIDASLATLRDAAAHAMPIDTFLRAVGAAKTLRLIALDACRDNPFVQEAHRAAARRRTADAGLADVGRRNPIGGGFAGVQPAEPNTLVLYSTQPGRVALDGDELNSPFTRAFVKNMPVRDLDLRQFLDRVRDDVARATERRQWPSVNGRLRAGDRLSFFPI